MQKLARHWSKRFGKKTFDYLHDFGDSWDHRIKVERRRVQAGVQVQQGGGAADESLPERGVHG
ncbi:IS1096 element passenger TnpR family protein [Pseudomonas sp. KB_12]|uniref:IS1096 element passenger TnpR family protein n=1 Tax=Pseudomonas sp. KB_12 TaxID=3233034 RepID=UPI003F9DFB28